MDRRTFLTIWPRIAGVAAIGGVMRGGSPGSKPLEHDPMASAPPEPTRDEGTFAAPADQVIVDRPSIARAVAKARDFDRAYDDDVWIPDPQWDLLVRTTARLERAQEFIGHGHFNRIGFDEIIEFAGNYSDIGSFERDELDLLDELFHADASRYGFLGEKVVANLTDTLDRRDLERIPGTGHYLLKGPSLEKFRRIEADLGSSVLLTSGVRGLAKQYHLFMRKAVETQGNLSQAARSLAPPGYSFHAIGDFDVGKRGLGPANFTDSFAETDEFKRLIDLGYIDIRYPESNEYGVRHEPWHIKIST